MDLELRDAVHDVIVDALAVTPVGLAARLPVPLEDVVRVPGERCELRRRRSREQQNCRREYTGEKPGLPGVRYAHGAPFTDAGGTNVEDNRKRSRVNPQLTG